MLKRNKRFIATLVGVIGVFLSITLCSADRVSAASSRIWGQDRYETAVAASKGGWETSDYVVLASGEGYADALCAAPLAKKYNAPILLTGGKSLNSKTLEEIKRLNAKHIIIIGKYASISQDIENSLSSIATDVKRLGGNDRYETSVIVAKELGTIDKIAVASGSGFADALSIAPIAAQENMPILLTTKDSLPEVVANYINENKGTIKSSYVVGAESSISSETAKKISESAVRLGGADRFETNLNVMKNFKAELKFDKIYIVQANGATGMEFADALSGAALAAKTSSPVILSYQTISDEVQSFVKENGKAESTIIALGGASAVPDSIVTKLEALFGTQTGAASGAASAGSGAASSGSGGTGSSSQFDADTREDLEYVLSKMDTIISKLGSQKEKDIAEKVADAINNALNDSTYDFKSEAAKVKKEYQALSDKEKDDFMYQVTSEIELSQALRLKKQFGL